MHSYDDRLDPALAAYIAQSDQFAPRSEQLADKREAFAKACRYFTPAPPPDMWIEDISLGNTQVRIYRPGGSAPQAGWPTVLYFHGGGWNMGSHETHDWFAFALLRRISVAIVAVDYRLAPEHPFPAPLDDGLAVWHALKQGVCAGLSTECIAVSGDSAGGSIAAGLCVALKEMQLPQPCLQALVYPVLTSRGDLNSMREHAFAPMLTTAGLMASLQGYVPIDESKSDPRALALEIRDASGLASAFIGVAEYDPLLDHGVEYADILGAAGVDVELYIGRGLVHASLRASGVTQVESFYDALARALRVATSAQNHL